MEQNDYEPHILNRCESFDQIWYAKSLFDLGQSLWNMKGYAI